METPVVCYPEPGTSIGDGLLQLVSVIGTGGYGAVYKALNPMSASHPYYAVKCLPRSQNHYQSRMREITLHQRASAHPGVIPLFRVLEEDDFTYLVMDYAPDKDLFTQILHKRRYLGNDILIRSTFIQILNVVEYCHSVGVYHRDLKPENFVCFEGGLRVALTDFGLATTQRTSTEFQTGSVYHMSPECQAAEMSCEGVYSPQSCDIWSLGIMLINIVTGRNPWNCAKWEDAAFRCYHQNPSHYFPTVLPISAELNEVLVMMLCMEWRARPAIAEIRDAVRRIPSFYSRDAVFDGSVAKCLWEGERYKRPVAHRVDLGDASRPGRTREQNPGNHLRTRIFKERFPLFEEGDSDGSPRDSSSSSSSSSSSASSTLGSARSSPAPSLDKRLKLRSKTTSFGSLLVGIQGLFRICPSLGRGKGRVGHVV